jgi:hypothetical protein
VQKRVKQVYERLKKSEQKQVEAKSSRMESAHDEMDDHFYALTQLTYTGTKQVPAVFSERRNINTPFAKVINDVNSPAQV